MPIEKETESELDKIDLIKYDYISRRGKLIDLRPIADYVHLKPADYESWKKISSPP